MVLVLLLILSLEVTFIWSWWMLPPRSLRSSGVATDPMEASRTLRRRTVMYTSALLAVKGMMITRPRPRPPPATEAVSVSFSTG